jgi:hypothetical protein
MQNPFQWIIDWWNQNQPYGSADVNEVKSGLRAEVSDASTIEESVTSCQYWVKGLPSVCQHWQNTSESSGEGGEGGETEESHWKCVYDFETVEDRPSGYGAGYCDNLGRRKWCSKYEPTITDEAEVANAYTCVAPSLEKSGAGKQCEEKRDHVCLRPYHRHEIAGYNENDGDGSGQCDGKGLGRGPDGIGDGGDSKALSELYKLPAMCRHYRPWQMGFGAVVPRPYHGKPPSSVWKPPQTYIPENEYKLHDGSDADPFTPVRHQLPFAFKIYNSRAAYQKCAYWDNPTGSKFIVDPFTGVFSMSVDGEYCICNDDACAPFRDTTEEWVDGLPYALQFIWAKGNTVVCNGAKPECPCYTGKWLYCTDDKMRDGMRITVNQLFELRFWAYNWPNQEDYEAYYMHKPNTNQGEYADESTADICTFTNWLVLNQLDVNKSKMQGYRHTLCMPAPLNNRIYDPEVFMQKEQINYARIQENTGTNVGPSTDGGNFEPGDVRYPTLLRDLDDPDEIVPPLDVIFPYYTDDPWNVEPCANFTGHFSLRSNIMGDVKVPVIGYTVQESTVYAFNLTGNRDNTPIGNTAPEFINSYDSYISIPTELRSEFNDNMRTFLSTAESKFHNQFANAESDKYGFFITEPIKVLYNRLNKFVVVCKYINDETGEIEYIFSVRKFWVTYYGAIISQDSFENNLSTEDEGFGRTLPAYYPKGVELTGYVNTTRGSVDEVISVYSHYRPSIYSSDKVYVSYCINEYTVGGDALHLETQWTRVGPTGYIWAEVNDININQLFDFQITSAKLYRKEDAEPNTCGDTSDYLELEVVYPKEVGGGIPAFVKRENIIPNGVLLQIKGYKPMALFGDEWDLYLEYKYQLLEKYKGDNVVWPQGIDIGNDPYFNYAPSPFEVEGGNNFVISNFGTFNSRGTPAVMAFVKDIDGRIQTAAATKLLLSINKIGCRTVDIHYRYRANATVYNLEPSTGFFTWRGAPSVSSSSETTHARETPCGDHDCNPANCKGPMWFPFDACSPDYYTDYDMSNFCTKPMTEGKDIVGKYIGGWRYSTVPEFDAWVTFGGNWASACGTAWYYHYSQAGNVEFTGYARIRSAVNVFEYRLYGWALPPFGNHSREFVERWLSRDFNSFIDNSEQRPKISAEFMPLVMDDQDFRSDPNCFAEPDSYSVVGEPFSYGSVMNTVLAPHVNEQIYEGERYRFEDIIEIVEQRGCTYPPPVYQGNKIIRYGFKSDDILWAWKEYWKDIERNILEGDGIENPRAGRLNMCYLERPDYYIGYDKTEYRLITEEQEVFITFLPITDERPYPGVVLEDGWARYYNWEYPEEEYSSEDSTDTAGWQDDNPKPPDGDPYSPGLYERANNPVDADGNPIGNEDEWLHDYNTIFDKDVDPNDLKVDDRKVYMGDSLFGKSYSYFCRGLILNIPKNRLRYMPMSSIDITPTAYQQPLINTDLMYYIEPEFVQDVLNSNNKSKILTITVEGNWGYTDDEVFSKPSVVFKEYYESEPGKPHTYEYSPILYPKSGKDKTTPGVESFKIYYELDTFPTRMRRLLSGSGIEQPPDPLLVVAVYLDARSTESLDITSVTMTHGTYIRRKEKLRIWECKYLVSTGESLENNPDGTKTSEIRKPHSTKLAGQYFDPDDSKYAAAANFTDKIMMVGASETVSEDVGLDATMGNLQIIEETAQRDLYLDAYNKDDLDNLTYNGIIPPPLEGFLQSTHQNNLVAYSLTIKDKKIPWEDSDLTRRFTTNKDSANFWQPGGHYYVWSNRAIRTRCYIFGGEEEVYKVKYVHHNHGGQEATAGPGQVYRGLTRFAFYKALDDRSNGQFSEDKGQVDQLVAMRPVPTPEPKTPTIVAAVRG